MKFLDAVSYIGGLIMGFSLMLVVLFALVVGLKLLISFEPRPVEVKKTQLYAIEDEDDDDIY